MQMPKNTTARIHHIYRQTKRGGGKGYQPVGVFGKGYRAERRNVARIVRRRTKQGRTISDTMQIIQTAHARASASAA